MVKYLIENGADFNVQADDGRTALVIGIKAMIFKILYNITVSMQLSTLKATEEGQLDVVKYLIEKGANSKILDKQGFDALLMGNEGTIHFYVRFYD